MNSEQKLTPKYWVGHNKATDDVFIGTATKSKDYTIGLMESFFGEDWFLDEDFEVILVEIKMADLK